ncbi:MAG: flagellar biosynthesis protein FlhA, partial [bacterium]|nr:flagellar biosynthesis protein FlhA [bacterium]
LTYGATDGMNAAGGVVKAFGDFVTNGNLLVGMILFAIIAIIQFVVITKGASRISEVAARFALDGMPGRQMAVDADLNAGVIDEAEASKRREDIAASGDFYGSMDGAAKFVRGDAIAGVIITAVNIVGGMAIGVFQDGMLPADAAGVFAKLAIGDGLISQIPALLISIAAGVLVSRSTQATDLSSEFIRQLFSRVEVMGVAAVFLGLLVFTELPTIPLLLLGSCCAGLAWFLSRQSEETTSEEEEAASTPPPAPADMRVEDYLSFDPLELELGVGLIRLADNSQGGNLLARIADVRRKVASEVGMVLPKMRVRDNLNLDRREYQVKIDGNVVVRGETGSINNDNAPEKTSEMAQRLFGVVRQYAADLLSRDAVKGLLDEHRRQCPAVVDELVPEVLTLSQVHQVLRNLLREEIPIRQLNAILECLGDAADQTTDPFELTELVRRRLARTLCQPHRDDAGRLHVVTLDPAIEQQLETAVFLDQRGYAFRLPIDAIEAISVAAAAAVDSLTRSGHPPILLCSPPIRAGLRRLLASEIPRLAALSYDEISHDTPIETHAVAKIAGAAAAA